MLPRTAATPTVAGMSQAWIEAQVEGDRHRVAVGGIWDVRHIGALEADAAAAAVPRERDVIVEMDALERLDTAGAWLLYRTIRDAREKEVRSARPEFRQMLEQVAANDRPCEIAPPAGNSLIVLLARIGAAIDEIGRESAGILSFFGHLLQTLAVLAVKPARLRFTALVFHLERMGFNSLPIVGLLNFLIGVVLGYLVASLLQTFGSGIFVADFLGVAILREIGILLTAIVIAGRSGSAITAEIGSMVVNEEVDAMRTLGLDPMEVLVAPRVLALVIALPVLAFFADIVGLAGGGLMAWIILDISPGLFIERLNEAVSTSTLWVGLAKAPIFAFLIGMVGCFEGLRVRRSAESVGQQTTRSVVTAIFLVIVADAVFAIFFQEIGI